MSALVKDYSTLFDVDAYLDGYFKDPKLEPWVLEKLHSFWKQFESKPGNIKLLEFGGGPNISRLISACQYVEVIVFSEYIDTIRQAVKNWVDKKGFDWKATFDFIVKDLEGQDDKASTDREEELRKKLKALIQCDITAGNPLDLSSLSDNLKPPYDVVFTSYCLEAVVESDEDYTDAISKLSKLVKPGGLLAMHGALEQSFYTVGKYDFYSYKLNKKLIEDSLKDAGIDEIVFDILPVKEKLPTFDADGEFFVYGTKK